jgi:hypothetical protein
MKQAYCILFALLIVYISGHQAFGQTKSRIGNAAEIAQLYKSKAKANQSQRSAATEVRHQAPGNKSISLKIQKSITEKNSDFYYGEIANTRNSKFFVQVTGNRVIGEVAMPDQKRYYRFTTEANGEVYLEEEDIDEVLCIGFEAYSGEEQRDNTIAAAAAIPALESLPGASAVILLDYDGHYVQGTLWNQVFNAGNPIDAQPMYYSESEIEAMWALISADFSAFDVNITTSEEVFNRAPVNKRGRVIFTTTNYFAPGWGGYAYIGSFSWGGGFYGETPSFVWNRGVVAGGNTASHEIGHMLHLRHDGRTSPVEEYFYGNGYWAPIMGAAFTPFAQWNNGDYPFANNKEDDLAVISTFNGFGYRADDHSNHAVGASALIMDATGHVSPTDNTGNISTSKDIDFFSFETAGGMVSLRVQPTATYSNLNPLLSLRSDNGELLQAKDVGQPFVALEADLPAGKYYLTVEGSASVYGAYSNYGSLGEYAISGYIPVSTPAIAVDLVSPASGTYFKADATIELMVSLDLPASTSIAKVTYFHGDSQLGSAHTYPYSLVWNDVATGDYALHAMAYTNQGEAFASEPIQISVVNGYGGGNRNTCELPDWQPDIRYVEGALVSLSGNVYEAQSTSLDSNPAASKPAKGDWKFRGPCRGALAANKTASVAAFSSDDIRIFPNPARNKGTLQVDLPTALRVAQVTLQEVGTGAKLLENTYQNVSKMPIQVNALPPGYYVLRIVSDDQVWTRKVIINP